MLDASVRLFAAAEGGRRGAVRSGYRPGVWVGETGPTGEPHLHSAILDLVGRSELDPGQASHVKLRPIALEFWPDVEAGAPFDVFEGERRVGNGTLAQAPGRAMSEPQLRK